MRIYISIQVLVLKVNCIISEKFFYVSRMSFGVQDSLAEDWWWIRFNFATS